LLYTSALFSQLHSYLLRLHTSRRFASENKLERFEGHTARGGLQTKTAGKVGPCAEACQALADLRLTQDRRGESLLLIRRTVEVCYHLPDGLAPSYDFRTVTARLLVELSQYDTAVSILKELTGEDGEDTEVLFLLGICHILCGRQAACGKVLGRAKELLAAGGAGPETQLVRQIDALLARRSVTEEEKRAFWNPRWWVQAAGEAGAGAGAPGAGGRATNPTPGGGGRVGGGAGAEDTGEGSPMSEVHESLEPLSPMTGVSEWVSDFPAASATGGGFGGGGSGSGGGGGGAGGGALGRTLSVATGGDVAGLDSTIVGAFEINLPAMSGKSATAAGPAALPGELPV